MDYPPGDMSISEVFITRIMESGILTREEAGKAAQDWLGKPRGHRLRAPCHRQTNRPGAAAARPGTGEKVVGYGRW